MPPAPEPEPEPGSPALPTPGLERSVPRAAPRPPDPGPGLQASRALAARGPPVQASGKGLPRPSTPRRAGLRGSRSPPRFLLPLSVGSRGPAPEPQSPLGSGSEVGGKRWGARPHAPDPPGGRGRKGARLLWKGGSNVARPVLLEKLTVPWRRLYKHTLHHKP